MYICLHACMRRHVKSYLNNITNEMVATSYSYKASCMQARTIINDYLCYSYI